MPDVARSQSIDFFNEFTQETVDQYTGYTFCNHAGFSDAFNINRRKNDIDCDINDLLTKQPMCSFESFFSEIYISEANNPGVLIAQRISYCPPDYCMILSLLDQLEALNKIAKSKASQPYKLPCAQLILRGFGSDFAAFSDRSGINHLLTFLKTNPDGHLVLYAQDTFPEKQVDALLDAVLEDKTICCRVTLGGGDTAKLKEKMELIDALICSNIRKKRQELSQETINKIGDAHFTHAKQVPVSSDSKEEDDFLINFDEEEYIENPLLLSSNLNNASALGDSFENTFPIDEKSTGIIGFSPLEEQAQEHVLQRERANVHEQQHQRRHRHEQQQEKAYIRQFEEREALASEREQQQAYEQNKVEFSESRHAELFVGRGDLLDHLHLFEGSMENINLDENKKEKLAYVMKLWDEFWYESDNLPKMTIPALKKWAHNLHDFSELHMDATYLNRDFLPRGFFLKKNKRDFPNNLDILGFDSFQPMPNKQNDPLMIRLHDTLGSEKSVNTLVGTVGQLMPFASFSKEKILSSFLDFVKTHSPCFTIFTQNTNAPIANPEEAANHLLSIAGLENANLAKEINKDVIKDLIQSNPSLLSAMGRLVLSHGTASLVRFIKQLQALKEQAEESSYKLFQETFLSKEVDLQQFLSPQAEEGFKKLHEFSFKEQEWWENLLKQHKAHVEKYTKFEATKNLSIFSELIEGFTYFLKEFKNALPKNYEIIEASKSDKDILPDFPFTEGKPAHMLSQLRQLLLVMDPNERFDTVEQRNKLSNLHWTNNGACTAVGALVTSDMHYTPDYVFTFEQSAQRNHNMILAKCLGLTSRPHWDLVSYVEYEYKRIAAAKNKDASCATTIEIRRDNTVLNVESVSIPSLPYLLNTLLREGSPLPVGPWSYSDCGVTVDNLITVFWRHVGQTRFLPHSVDQYTFFLSTIRNNNDLDPSIKRFLIVFVGYFTTRDYLRHRMVRTSKVLEELLETLRILQIEKRIPVADILEILHDGFNNIIIRDPSKEQQPWSHITLADINTLLQLHFDNSPKTEGFSLTANFTQVALQISRKMGRRDIYTDETTRFPRSRTQENFTPSLSEKTKKFLPSVAIYEAFDLLLKRPDMDRMTAALLDKYISIVMPQSGNLLVEFDDKQAADLIHILNRLPLTSDEASFNEKWTKLVTLIREEVNDANPAGYRAGIKELLAQLADVSLTENPWKITLKAVINFFEFVKINKKSVINKAPFELQNLLKTHIEGITFKSETISHWTKEYIREFTQLLRPIVQLLNRNNNVTYKELARRLSNKKECQGALQELMQLADREKDLQSVKEHLKRTTLQYFKTKLAQLITPEEDTNTENEDLFQLKTYFETCLHQAQNIKNKSLVQEFNAVSKSWGSIKQIVSELRKIPPVPLSILTHLFLERTIDRTFSLDVFSDMLETLSRTFPHNTNGSKIFSKEYNILDAYWKTVLPAHPVQGLTTKQYWEFTKQFLETLAEPWKKLPASSGFKASDFRQLLNRMLGIMRAAYAQQEQEETKSDQDTPAVYQSLTEILKDLSLLLAPKKKEESDANKTPLILLSLLFPWLTDEPTPDVQKFIAIVKQSSYLYSENFLSVQQWRFLVDRTKQFDTADNKAESYLYMLDKLLTLKNNSEKGQEDTKSNAGMIIDIMIKLLPKSRSQWSEFSDSFDQVVHALQKDPDNLKCIHSTLFTTPPYPECNRLFKRMILHLDDSNSPVKGLGNKDFPSILEDFSRDPYGVLRDANDKITKDSLHRCFTTEHLYPVLDAIRFVGVDEKSETVATKKKLLKQEFQYINAIGHHLNVVTAENKSNKPFWKWSNQEFINQLSAWRAIMTDASGATEEEKHTVRLNFLGMIRTILGRLGKLPHSTQILSTLLIRQHPNLLAQINTGEGKSIIAMLQAALLWLEDGGPVCIYTADMGLAARDYQNFSVFFQALNIPVSLISEASDPSSFESKGINISTTGHMALFLENAAIENKPIKNIGRAVIDEGDQATLDQKAKFNTAVPININILEPHKNRFAWMYEQVNNFLQNQNLGDFAGERIRENLPELCANLRGYLKTQAPDEVDLDHKLTDYQLNIWLCSAYSMSQLKENVHYVIKSTRREEEGEWVDYSCIRILNDESRIVSSIFGLGGQQLLHALLNVRYADKIDDPEDPMQKFVYDPETLCVHSSTVKNLLDCHTQIVAITGSAGGSFELKHKYGMDCVIIPPHFKSERKLLPLQVVDDTEDEGAHARRVAAQIVEFENMGEEPGALNAPPVLVFCKDIPALFNSAEEGGLAAKVVQELGYVLDGTKDSGKQQRINLEAGSKGYKTLLYITGSETEAQRKELFKQAGKAGTLTFTTSVSARGIDIDWKGSSDLGCGINTYPHGSKGDGNSQEGSRMDRQKAGRFGRMGRDENGDLCAKPGIFINIFSKQQIKERVISADHSGSTLQEDPDFSSLGHDSEADQVFVNRMYKKVADNAAIQRWIEETCGDFLNAAQLCLKKYTDILHKHGKFKLYEEELFTLQSQLIKRVNRLRRALPYQDIDNYLNEPGHWPLVQDAFFDVFIHGIGSLDSWKNTWKVTKRKLKSIVCKKTENALIGNSDSDFEEEWSKLYSEEVPNLCEEVLRKRKEGKEVVGNIFFPNLKRVYGEEIGVYDVWLDFSKKVSNKYRTWCQINSYNSRLLHFYFTDLDGWTAINCEGAPVFKAALEKIEASDYNEIEEDQATILCNAVKNFLCTALSDNSNVSAQTYYSLITPVLNLINYDPEALFMHKHSILQAVFNGCRASLPETLKSKGIGICRIWKRIHGMRLRLYRKYSVVYCVRCSRRFGCRRRKLQLYLRMV